MNKELHFFFFACYPFIYAIAILSFHYLPRPAGSNSFVSDTHLKEVGRDALLILRVKLLYAVCAYGAKQG